MMWGTYDDGIFDSSVKCIDIIGKKYQDEDADKIKSIMLLNGNCEDVRYVESIKSDIKDYAIYSSENGNISCRYDSESNLLTQISAENNAIPIPTNFTKESDYRNWVKKLLTIYGVNNLSSYKYSCETGVGISNENSYYQKKYPYFYTDLAVNEEINNYSFTYTRYLGGYPTTDRISLYISMKTKSVIIKFDEQDFVDIPKATIDDSTITAAINSYIMRSLNTDKYELASIQIMNKTLTRFENKVCLNVDVEMTFIDKKEQVTICNSMALLLCQE